MNASLIRLLNRFIEKFQGDGYEVEQRYRIAQKRLVITIALREGDIERIKDDAIRKVSGG